MQTITLEKEHWEAFAEILEDIYAKDNPYKYVLANAIRDAVAASHNNTADVEFDDDGYEEAVKIADDIDAFFYAMYPGAVYVASALGIKGKKQKVSFRKKYPSIVTISLTAQEIGIIQAVCKEQMLYEDEDSLAYNVASALDSTLDSIDIGDDYDFMIHVFYLDPLTKALQDKIDDEDTPRKDRIIMGHVQGRLLTIFSKYNKTIPKTQLRKQMHMSESEKIRLAADEINEFESQNS